MTKVLPSPLLRSHVALKRGFMWQLFQFPLCPFSRKVRLVLGEKGVAHELVRENPWERRDEFVDLNPAGETPVLVDTSLGITLIEIGRAHV